MPETLLQFEPPYYAVIFTAILSEDLTAYEEMIPLVRQEAESIHGFLGMESATDALEISVSYWSNLDAIQQWRHNVMHLEAKHLGITKWFDEHRLRITRVEEEY